MVIQGQTRLGWQRTFIDSRPQRAEIAREIGTAITAYLDRRQLIGLCKSPVVEEVPFGRSETRQRRASTKEGETSRATSNARGRFAYPLRLSPHPISVATRPPLRLVATLVAIVAANDLRPSRRPRPISLLEIYVVVEVGTTSV